MEPDRCKNCIWYADCKASDDLTEDCEYLDPVEEDEDYWEEMSYRRFERSE